MLGWTIVDLARAAQVSIAMVKRMEDPGSKPIPGHMPDLVREAMREAGVSFLVDDGSGPGVRILTSR